MTGGPEKLPDITTEEGRRKLAEAAEYSYDALSTAIEKKKAERAGETVAAASELVAIDPGLERDKLREQLAVKWTELMGELANLTLKVRIEPGDVDSNGKLTPAKSLALTDQIQGGLDGLSAESWNKILVILGTKFKPGDELKEGFSTLVKLYGISSVESRLGGKKPDSPIDLELKGFDAASGDSGGGKGSDEIEAKKDAIVAKMKEGGFWSSLLVTFLKAPGPNDPNGRPTASLLDKLARGEGGFWAAVLGIMGVQHEDFQNAAAEMKKTAAKHPVASRWYKQAEGFFTQKLDKSKEAADAAVDFAAASWKAFYEEGKPLSVATKWPNYKLDKLCKMKLPPGDGKLVLAPGQSARIASDPSKAPTVMTAPQDKALEIPGPELYVAELAEGTVLPAGTTLTPFEEEKKA